VAGNVFHLKNKRIFIFGELMKVALFFLLFLLLVSCSGGGNSPGSITSGLSVSQKEAQTLIQNDIQHLKTEQYSISASDLDLLNEDGLITQEELNSLNIIK
jgi:hypothetical protein